jgi:hypothetical protein
MWWLTLLFQLLTLTGPALVPPGQPVRLGLEFDPQGASVAALQWTLALPTGVSASVVSGPAAIAAGKTVSCNGSTCIAYGLNATAIGSGTVAYADLTPTTPGRWDVPLSGLAAATPGGQPAPLLSGLLYGLWVRPWAVSNLHAQVAEGGGEPVSISLIAGSVAVSSNVNSGSTSVTIPAGATFALITAAAWNSTAFTSNAITLDGQTATLILASPIGGGEGGFTYRVSGFSVGSGKTFAWDWNGTSDPGDGALYQIVFFSGVDLVSPVRDSDYAAQSPTETPLIDTSATDLVVVWASGYDAPSMDLGVSGQTEQIAAWSYNNCYAAAATIPGTAGQISGHGTGIDAYGTLTAISLQAAAGGATGNPYYAYAQQ